MTPKARKRLIVVIVIFTAIVGSFFLARQVRKAKHAQLIASEKQAGLDFHRLGEYEKALDHLRYYISENQDDGAMLLIFAECRLNVPKDNNKHIIEGTGLIQRAADYLPNDPEPLLRLIDLYEQLGYLTERLDTCAKLLTLDPQNLAALEARIETLYLIGNQNDEALLTADQWIKLEPASVIAHQWNMMLLDLAGKSGSDLVDYAEQKSAQFPDHLGFATLYAQALAINLQFDEAKEIVKLAMKLPASDADEIRDLVDILDRLGEADKADTFLTRELENATDQRADVALVIVERAWKRGELDLAQQFLPVLPTSFEDAQDDLLGWTVFLTQSTSKPAQDQEAFDALTQRQTKSARARVWVRLLQGRDAIFQLNWIAARQSLLEATRIEVSHPIASMLLGQVYQTLGENGLAIQWYRRAAESDPVWPTIHQLLGLAYLEAGQLAEARASAEAAFLAKPTPAQYALVAEIYIQLLEAGQGDLNLQNNAVDVLQQLLAELPDDPFLIATTARAYLVTNRVDEALPLIDRMLDEKLRPHTTVLLELVDTCTRKNLTVAHDLLILGGNSEQSDIRLTLRLAQRAADQGRFEEGRILIQQAIDIAIGENDILECKMALASYLDQFNDPLTIPSLKQLANDYPDSAIVQRFLLDTNALWNEEALVQSAIGRLKDLTGPEATTWKIYDARQLLTFLPTGENAIDPDSTQDVFVQNAGRVLVLLNPLAQANPSDIRVQALLCEAHLITGERQHAISALATAIDANGSQVSLYPRLIELLAAEGRIDDVQERLRDFVRRSIPSNNHQLKRMRASLLLQNAFRDSSFWAAALADVQPLAELGATNDLITLASIYEQTGKQSQANETFNLALQNDDVSAVAIATTAIVFFSDWIVDLLFFDTPTRALPLFHE